MKNSLCCICGEPLNPRSEKVCSSKCRAIFVYGEKKERQCLICGGAFMPKKNSTKIATCSRKCGVLLMKKTKKDLGIGWPKEAWIASAKSWQGDLGEERRENARIRVTGTIHTLPNMARNSPKHHNGVVFFVKSPRNITYLVMNATAFVVANESLFPPETVVWKANQHSDRSLYCLASRGLQKLGRGDIGSWHGWMKVGNTEGKEAVDYLPREFIDAES